MPDIPQLQQGFEVFANWQTALFCLAIYLATQFIRSIVENAPATKSLAAGWVWTTVLLPFGPVGTGILLSLLCKKFPWPTPVADVMSAKLMYGTACGMASGWVYARVRDWFGVAAESGNPMAKKVLGRTSVTGTSPSAFGPKKG